MNVKIAPINSVLVANRGEIASRVFRTCRMMGIRTVAIYSDADRDMPFVSDADEAIHIGGSAPVDSYLNMNKIIEAAQKMQVDAIHPGYGFLSENADFASMCAHLGFIFIGPHPSAIAAMGSKATAKILMEEHGIPVVPGYNGSDQAENILISEAEKIGFPLLLKAAAGGGGKGMRIVRSAEELSSAISSAKRESQSAFGDDRLIIEKYIESGRHIEFQIIGDKHGHAIHLLERECSLQRRYQKVVEESPSPIMTADLRHRMGESALKAAIALNYDNAGTLEFIYDEHSGEYYFLEVNTRLQVEHPVTEAITGLDIVQLQIESAEGRPLQITQNDVKSNGYAVEVRLYAEDAGKNFTPVTGKVEMFEVPKMAGVRVESAIKSGSNISVFYDPMIAKIIAHGGDRAETLRKMSYLLRNTICTGTVTNQDFLLKIIEDERFLPGLYNTQFLDREFSYIVDNSIEVNLKVAAIASTVYAYEKRKNESKLLGSLPSGWRNSFYANQRDSYKVNDTSIDVEYRHINESLQVFVGENVYEVITIDSTHNSLIIQVNGKRSKYFVSHIEDTYHVHNASIGNISLLKKERLPTKEKEKIEGGYDAPMPCSIIKVNVKVGSQVKKGEALLVLSSMKMESVIESSEDGVVEEVYVTEGQNIEAGYLMLKMKQNIELS